MLERPRHRAPGWVIESVIIVCLLVSYLVIQSIYLAEPRHFDAADYMRFADTLPPELIHHRPLRIGLLIPLWAMMGVFGYTEATFYIFSYAAGSALVVSVYGLGRVLFNRLLAFAAATIIMTSPIVLRVSSQIWPDIPGTALFTLGVVFMLISVKRLTNDQQPRAYYLLLVLAGLFFGWAYLVRELLVFLLPIVLLIWWRIGIPWKHLPLVVGGAAIMLLGELAWGAYVHGDPFVRFRVLLDLLGGRFGSLSDLVGSVPASTGDATIARAQSSANDLGTQFLESIWTFPQTLTTYTVVRWVLICLTAILAGATVILRKAPLTVVASWLFSGWLIVAVIGIESRAFAIQSRYWLPLLPPMIVGGLGALQAIAKSLLPHRSPSSPVAMFSTVLPTLLALVLVGTGIHEMNSEGFAFGQPHREESALYEVREWLSTDGQEWDVIWTDVFTARTLPMYTRSFFGTPMWEGEVRRFRGDMTEVDRDGLLLFRTSSLGGPRRPEVPPYLPAPPRDWSVEFISESGDMIAYGVGAGDRFTHIGFIGDPSSGPEWLAIENDGSQIPLSGPAETVKLRARETLRITDDNGPGNLTEAGIQAPTVEAGSHVRIRSQVKIDGDGSMEVFCLFYGSEKVTRVSSSSALSRSFEGTSDKTFNGDVDFLCESPQFGEPQQLRVEIRLEGPVDLELGPVQIESDHGE